MTVIHSALAGGDCLDDADALRAAGAGSEPDAEVVDVDSTVCETSGVATQGAKFGYAHQRG